MVLSTYYLDKSHHIFAHLGYKKCLDNKIVVLQILQGDNEKRNGILDKEYAAYNCQKAKVIDIHSSNDETAKFDEALSIHYQKCYRRGEIVVADNGQSRAAGIYYFLSRDVAYHYLSELERPNGERKSWHLNGRLASQCTYVNGKKYGLEQKWYPNGNRMCCTDYWDGERHGRCQWWYEDYPKQLESESMFDHGRVWRRRSWHKNGYHHGYGFNWHTKRPKLSNFTIAIHRALEKFFENGA